MTAKTPQQLPSQAPEQRGLPANEAEQAETNPAAQGGLPSTGHGMAADFAAGVAAGLITTGEGELDELDVMEWLDLEGDEEGGGHATEEPPSSSTESSEPSAEEAKMAKAAGLSSDEVKIKEDPTVDGGMAKANTILMKPGMSKNKRKKVLAHELVHVAQAKAAGGIKRTNTSARDPRAEKDARKGADALAKGETYKAKAVASGEHHFEATMPKDHEGNHDAEAATHEGQTIDAALKAGFTKEEAEEIYKGNFFADFNQVGLPSTAGINKELYSLLEILHLKHFGNKMELGDREMKYDPIEHLDNPAGLTGADVYGPSEDQSIMDWDPRYVAAHSKLGQESILNPKDPKALQVDEKGVPAYMIATGESVKARLREALTHEDKNEGLRLIGLAMHGIQDLFAHSNVCEVLLNLALKHGWLGEENESLSLDTQVHALKGGIVQQENLTTASGREVLATGTFKGKDTLQSLMGKLTGELASNPFTESEGPNEMAMALLMWLQSGPEEFGEEAEAISKHFVTAAQVLGTAAIAYLKLKSQFTRDEELQKAFKDQSLDVLAAMLLGLNKPGGLARFYAVLVESAEGPGLLELASPVFAAFSSLYDEVLRPELERAYQAVLDEAVNPALQTATDRAASGGIGETRLAPGSENTSQEMTSPSHTSVAKDNHKENQHAHGEEDSTHAATWLQPMANALSREVSIWMLTLVKTYQDAPEANRAVILEDIESLVDLIFSHPEDHLEVWKAFFERKAIIHDEAFMRDLKAHARGGEAEETEEDKFSTLTEEWRLFANEKARALEQALNTKINWVVENVLTGKKEIAFEVQAGSLKLSLSIKVDWDAVINKDPTKTLEAGRSMIDEVYQSLKASQEAGAEKMDYYWNKGEKEYKNIKLNLEEMVYQHEEGREKPST